MKIKEIELKNGEIAILHFNTYPNQFKFVATDKKGKPVASCLFSIKQIFKLQNPSTSKGCQISNTTALLPTLSEIEISLNGFLANKIQNNQLAFANGRIYMLQDIICKLELIEICDERFYKVGLGSKLCKLMESFAIQHNCTKISAWVYPIGQFEMGTMEFYARNGFTFTQNHTGDTIATKQLIKENLSSQNMKKITSKSIQQEFSK